MKQTIILIGLCILLFGCSSHVDYEININKTKLNQTHTKINTNGSINYSDLVAGDITWSSNATFLSDRKPMFAIHCANISNQSLEIYTKEGLWEVITHEELCKRILQDNH